MIWWRGLGLNEATDCNPSWRLEGDRIAKPVHRRSRIFRDKDEPRETPFRTLASVVAILAWTVSVRAGFLGSLALLTRSGPAISLFLLTTAGTAGYVVWPFLLSSGVEAMGMMWLMPLLVGTATLALPHMR